MDPVRHRRFPGCSLARHALQRGAHATSPTRTDSVLLRALALHCAHHTFGATERFHLLTQPPTIQATPWYALQLIEELNIIQYFVNPGRHNCCKQAITLIDAVGHHFGLASFHSPC